MSNKPIYFNKIKSKTRKEVYEFFRSNNCKYFQNKQVYKTLHQGKLSSNSYNLGGYNYKTKLDTLIKFFNISNRKQFEEKFQDAVSGEGFEIQRITVMHSSSLCALLCFYDVKNRHIKLNINNEEIEFTDSIFEWENTVTDNGGPSSIDVVLIGHNSKNKPIILFLESKFSEYFETGVCHPRDEYLHVGKDFYKSEVFNSKLGLQFNPKIIEYKSGKAFTIGKGNKQYATGIKQMISHYLGVKNFVTGNNRCLNKGKHLNKNAKVYLGAVLFNFNFEPNTAFTNYSNLYNKLAKVMNDKNPGFTILPSLLTYQSIFTYKNNIKQLDDNVIKYYKFKD